MWNFGDEIWKRNLETKFGRRNLGRRNLGFVDEILVAMILVSICCRTSIFLSIFFCHFVQIATYAALNEKKMSKKPNPSKKASCIGVNCVATLIEICSITE